MKKAIAICAAAALVFCSCSNYTSKEKQPESISKATVDSVSYLLGYNFGQIIKGNNFGSLNINEIVKGMKDCGNDVKVEEELLYSTINSFLETRMKAVAETNKAAAEKFFEENGKKEGVITTESGLQFKIERDGNGVKPTNIKDQVEVNYEGCLLDGTVFDSSYERGESASFALNQVIKGWGEGLQNIDEGGEITLWIPADLAYGDRGAGDKITPGSALKFKVELIKVTPAPAEEKK